MASPSIAVLQSTQMRSVATRFLQLRPWIVAPGLLIAACLLHRAGVSELQLRVSCLGYLVAISFFTIEALLVRRRPVSELWFVCSLALTAVFIAVASSTNGAIRSPLLPLLFAPTVIAFSAFGRRWWSHAMAIYVVGLLVALWAIPEGQPFPALPEPEARALGLTAFVLTAALCWVGVGGLTDAFVVAGQRVESLQAERIAEDRRRLRSLEALSGKLAHELKNPLAAISGLAQLLARAQGDAAYQRRVGVLVEESARMDDILRDYLSFSRPLEALSVAEVKLDELLAELCARMRGHCESAEVQLSLDNRVATDAVIEVDRRRLGEALVNLVQNAVEASRAGSSARIFVVMDADVLTIDIEDSGGRMGAAELAKLGTPYHTTKSGGTGLGIAIARTVVEQHGGELAFEAIDSGLRARLTLPVRGRHD